MRSFQFQVISQPKFDDESMLKDKNSPDYFVFEEKLQKKLVGAFERMEIHILNIIHLTGSVVVQYVLTMSK